MLRHIRWKRFWLSPTFLAGMTHPVKLLKAIFAGDRPIIESPVLTELETEGCKSLDEFKAVPNQIERDG